MTTLRLLTLILLAAACADDGRKKTDPIVAPPLDELTDSQVRTTMGRIAGHMIVVDEIIQVADPAHPAERAKLSSELKTVLELIEGFGPEALDPHHQQFGWRLVTLRDDVRLARAAVDAEPPEYDLVRNLSSSCTYCHEARRSGRRR